MNEMLYFIPPGMQSEKSLDEESPAVETRNQTSIDSCA